MPTVENHHLKLWKTKIGVAKEWLIMVMLSQHHHQQQVHHSAAAAAATGRRQMEVSDVALSSSSSLS